MSFGDEEVLSEGQMNDDHFITEDDCDEYVNVHGEIFNTSDRELLENVARDSEDEVRDDDEITAEEIDDQQNKLDVDILDNKDQLITVDIEGYSEAISKKPRMFSEVEIKGVGLVSQVENSDEAQKNRDKFLDAEVATKEVSQLQLYESSQENRVVNLDIIKNTFESGKDNKASKDEMDGCDGDTVIDEKIKSVKEEIDELEDMDGDHDETLETTEEIRLNMCAGKKSGEAFEKVFHVVCTEFGENHDSADSMMLEENDMEVNAEVVKVLFKGTFLKNSKEILENLYKFPEVKSDQDDSHDTKVEKDYVKSTLQENHNDERNILVAVDEDQAKKSTIIKVLYEGTYLENLKEINENLNKCNEIDDENIDVNVLNGNFFSTENLKNFALETLATVNVKDYNKEKIQPSSVVDDVTEHGDDESNVAASGAADAPVIKDTERIEFKVMLLVILTVCFILVSIVRIAVSNLITLFLHVLQYIHLSLMVAMLDMLLEHDTKLMGNTEKELMFPDLLDRAWDKFEECKIELFDGMLVVQDRLLSILRAINTDLGNDQFNDEEEDLLLFSASANTKDTMSPT